MSSANAFNLDQSENLSFGKELKYLQTTNASQMMGFFSLKRLKKLWKRKNADYQHFLLFPRFFSTLFQTTNCNSSKLKELADNNSRFEENGGKFYKRVEKAVGKGEIACKEQSPFSHSVFKRLVLQTHKNKGLFGKGCMYIFLQGHPNR